MGDYLTMELCKNIIFDIANIFLELYRDSEDPTEMQYIKDTIKMIFDYIKG